jgi:serine protease Do
VQIQAVSKEEADAFGLGAPRGALVNGVEADGPAAKAGVEVGDIIVKADGKEVRSSSSCRASSPRSARAPRFRDGVAQGLAEGPEHRRRRDEGRPGRDAAQQGRCYARRRRRKPNKMGLVLSDLTDDQKKEADVQVGVDGRRTSRRRCAATCRPATSSSPSCAAGSPPKHARLSQVNDVLGKVEKGAS